MTTLNAPSQPMPESVAVEPMPQKPRTVWRDAVDRIKQNRTAMVAMAVLGIYIITALAGFTPTLDRARDAVVSGANQPPFHNEAGNVTFAPSLWFGTDFLGRSVLWRFLYGARVA